MNEFEIDLPNEKDLVLDVNDKSLYNYDFNSYSLVTLQDKAAVSVLQRMRKSLYSNISASRTIEKIVKKDDTEYVAKLSEYTKEKLNSGEWTLGLRKKTGETYAVLKDSTSGKNLSFLTLEEKVLNELGSLPDLAAIQGQLKDISEQIESLNHTIERVEQGQYNDRFAGFFSARQMVVEALVAVDDELRRELLISAVKTANDTISKLMFSIHQDSLAFIDLNIKKKEAHRIDELLQNSIGYLNSTIQLNLIAYTVLGEEKSLLATLNNFHSYIDQTLLKTLNDSEKTVAWKIDNVHVGNNGKFVELTSHISEKISGLIENTKVVEIGGKNYDKLESENM